MHNAMTIAEYVLAAIAVVGVIVALVFGLPVAYTFFQELRKNRALYKMQLELNAMKHSLAKYELGYGCAMSSLISLAEMAFIQRAVFEEVLSAGSDSLQLADRVLFDQRVEIMKSIHQTGLAHPDDQIALDSSFALATEFGDFDTIELMKKLESFRAAANLSEFERHRRFLKRRLHVS